MATSKYIPSSLQEALTRSPALRQRYAELQNEMSKYNNPGIRTGAINLGSTAPSINTLQGAYERHQNYYNKPSGGAFGKPTYVDMTTEQVAAPELTTWKLDPSPMFGVPNPTTSLQETIAAIERLQRNKQEKDRITEQVNRLFTDLRDLVTGQITKSAKHRITNFLTGLQAL